MTKKEEILQLSSQQEEEAISVQEEGTELAPTTAQIAQAKKDNQGDHDQQESEAEGAVPPHKSKFGWLSYPLLLAIIALGIYMMIAVATNMTEGELMSFTQVFGNAKWQYVLVLVGVIGLSIIVPSAMYYVTTHAIEGKANPLTSVKVYLYGKYYDNITPFGTGGQPMQIYYLHKKGYSGAHSSAVVLIRYFSQMFSWLAIGIVLLSTHTQALIGVDHGTLILVAGWIGMFINILLPTFVLSFVLFPRFANKLTSGVIRLGKGLHLVKDADLTKQKALQIVHDFSVAFGLISKKPWHLATLVLLCIIDVVVTFSVPFVVMGMLAYDSSIMTAENWFLVMALNAYATYAVSVIPTPGNTGVSETVSLLAFTVILGQNVGIWVVLTWRFVIVYQYLLIGVLVMIYDVIAKIIKDKRAKRQPLFGKNKLGS